MPRSKVSPGRIGGQVLFGSGYVPTPVILEWVDHETFGVFRPAFVYFSFC